MKCRYELIESLTAQEYIISNQILDPKFSSKKIKKHPLADLETNVVISIFD